MEKKNEVKAGGPTITFRPVVGEPKVRYRDEGLVILGKFCYNLAALVFVALGWILIKIGLCKIK